MSGWESVRVHSSILKSLKDNYKKIKGRNSNLVGVQIKEIINTLYSTNKTVKIYERENKTLKSLNKNLENRLMYIKHVNRKLEKKTSQPQQFPPPKSQREIDQERQISFLKRDLEKLKYDLSNSEKNNARLTLNLNQLGSQLISEQKKNSSLFEENTNFKKSLLLLQKRVDEQVLTLDYFMNLPNDKFKHFTGLIHEHFETEFQKFLPYLQQIKISSTKLEKSERKNNDVKKLKSYFLITFIRLRRAWKLKTLSALFGTGFSLGTVSSAIRNVIRLMSSLISTLPLFTYHNYTKNMTDRIRVAFPSSEYVVFLVDTTYLYIQKSKNLQLQRMTYCNYKKKNLIKLLTLNSSNGKWVHFWENYPGGDGDKKILRCTKNLREFLEYIVKVLKRKVIIFSDNGFDQKQMPQGVQVLSPNIVKDGFSNFMCCSTRISVENYYAHLKHFRLLKEMDNKSLDIVDDMVRVCIYIHNLYLTPLRK